MACENNEHRRPENYGGRGSRCPRYRGSPPEIISSGARGVSFFLDSPFNRTNILLRWAGELTSRDSTNILPRWGRGTDVSRFYKHTAPLGQGIWRLAILQTYCPAGAGEDALRKGEPWSSPKYSWRLLIGLRWLSWNTAMEARKGESSPCKADRRLATRSLPRSGPLRARPARRWSCCTDLSRKKLLFREIYLCELHRTCFLGTNKRHLPNRRNSRT